MRHYHRIQNAIDFIEDHLAESFTLAEVSRQAFSSLSHFHRIFYFMTGYTVKEYIRKRRLSKAAYQLRCDDETVMAIALQAGYETTESFSRAFKKQYQNSPRDFRKLRAENMLEPKLDVLRQFSQRAEPALDFSLELNYVLFQEKTVCGFQTHTTIEGGQQAIDICHFSNDILASKTLDQYFDVTQSPVFGVYTNMTDEDDFDYTIGCLQTNAITSTDTLVSLKIPTSRYARFTLNRFDRIKEAWHYIYGDWFLHNDADRTRGYDFEIYHQDSVDIYIPMAGV